MLRSQKYNRQAVRGFTLTETALVMVIIGIGLMAAKTALNLLQTVGRAQVVSETHRDLQAELYNITRDIRNASRITTLSPDSLVLQTPNVTKGYNTFLNPDLFLTSNQMTINYQYIAESTGTCLRRTSTVSGVAVTKDLLKNRLVPVDGTNYLFKDLVSFAGIITSVEVVLRSLPVQGRNKIRNYRSEVMMRASS